MKNADVVSAARIFRLSPVIPTSDLESTQVFLMDLLGLNLGFASPHYRVLTKDGCDVHLALMGEKAGQMQIYMEVDDLDQIWKKYCELDPGSDAKPPSDKSHGMREFHIFIPNTRVQLSIGRRGN